MDIIDKFANLVQDDDNKLRFTLIKKGLNYFVIIEKLHSLNQWLKIFLQEYYLYKETDILSGDINKKKHLGT